MTVPDIAKGRINFCKKGLVVRSAWASGRIGGVHIKARVSKNPFQRGIYEVMADRSEAVHEDKRKLPNVQLKGDLPKVLDDMPDNDLTEILTMVVKRLAKEVRDVVKPTAIIDAQNVRGDIKNASLREPPIS